MAGDRDPARLGDYRAARVGAAAALVFVVVLLLVIDAFLTTYELSPMVLIPILGTVAGLLSVDISNTLRGGK